MMIDTLAERAEAVREDPTEYWSRVLCLWRDEPITDATVGAAIEF